MKTGTFRDIERTMQTVIDIVKMTPSAQSDVTGNFDGAVDVNGLDSKSHGLCDSGVGNSLATNQAVMIVDNIVTGGNHGRGSSRNWYSYAL